MVPKLLVQQLFFFFFACEPLTQMSTCRVTWCPALCGNAQNFNFHPVSHLLRWRPAFWLALVLKVEPLQDRCFPKTWLLSNGWEERRESCLDVFVKFELFYNLTQGQYNMKPHSSLRATQEMIYGYIPTE